MYTRSRMRFGVRRDTMFRESRSTASSLKHIKCSQAVFGRTLQNSSFSHNTHNFQLS